MQKEKLNAKYSPVTKCADRIECVWFAAHIAVHYCEYFGAYISTWLSYKLNKSEIAYTFTYERLVSSQWQSHNNSVNYYFMHRMPNTVTHTHIQRSAACVVLHPEHLNKLDFCFVSIAMHRTLFLFLSIFSVSGKSECDMDVSRMLSHVARLEIGRI